MQKFATTSYTADSIYKIKFIVQQYWVAQANLTILCYSNIQISQSNPVRYLILGLISIGNPPSISKFANNQHDV